MDRLGSNPDDPALVFFACRRIDGNGYSLSTDQIPSRAAVGIRFIGAAGSFSLVVMPDQLASRFKDVTLPPLLATPVMIMVMENAALNAIKPYLDASESALGTRVDVRHLAATPPGRRVTGEAKVTNVDGRRIEFSIRVADGNEEIGVGTHERMVIHLAKLSERMKAKFGQRCDNRHSVPVTPNASPDRLVAEALPSSAQFFFGLN
jgi:fluoroacetyl-CoA thioesterase